MIMVSGSDAVLTSTDTARSRLTVSRWFNSSLELFDMVVPTN
jgi:hypothetical protein